MRKSLFRHSRAGLSHMAIAGIVAGIAVLGYVGYKWYKNRQNPTASAYGQHQQMGFERRRPVQQFPQQHYQQMTQGPKGYAFAPTSSRDANGQDPELNRLFAATQQAQLRFNASLASGDRARQTTARSDLADAQAKLNIKKASMY